MAVYTLHGMVNVTMMPDSHGLEQQSYQGVAVQTIQIVVLTLTFFIVVFGNIVMLHCLLSIKEMKNTTGILLISLVTTDLGVGIFCIPFAIATTADHDLVHSRLFCNMTGFSLILFLDSSLLTMAVISVQKYMTIGYSLQPRFTRKHALYGILAIWTISLLFASAPAVGWDSYAHSTHGHQCAPSGRYLLGLTYQAASLTCCLVVPTITMMYCNGKILIFLRAHMSKMKASGISRSRFSKRPGVSAAERRMVKTLMLMMLLFFISWSPCFIYMGMEIAQANYPPYLEDIVLDFAFASSAVNPILYAMRHREFRKGFKLSILKLCRMTENTDNQHTGDEHCVRNAFTVNIRLQDMHSSETLI
ncbi:galanin receptor 2b-like [Rhopilema esculentum]|uniref:galanin receptor 2b-like n=1 Tax=Rhopilema esculentum TaxID=499914 RepID=UPI0031CF167C|eukprot:gene2925-1167_t